MSWICQEHGEVIAEGQSCSKCLDIAGDLLADCVLELGRDGECPHCEGYGEYENEWGEIVWVCERCDGTGVEPDNESN